jgi:hypothetical protein
LRDRKHTGSIFGDFVDERLEINLMSFDQVHGMVATTPAKNYSCSSEYIYGDKYSG